MSTMKRANSSVRVTFDEQRKIKSANDCTVGSAGENVVNANPVDCSNRNRANKPRGHLKIECHSESNTLLIL